MTRMPLEGIRIADFGHIFAVPYLTRLFADHGAEVIKVESRANPDALRQLGSNPDRSDLTTTISFSEFNRNKLSVTINLKTARGIEIVKKLIQISDVVTENFSAGVMTRLGLDYPALKEIKPDLIMLKSSGLGQTGPYKDHVAWGPTLMPLMGMIYLWSYDESEPIGARSAYPDWVSGALGAFAVLAALEYRKKTGKGQLIDLSQLEAMATLFPMAHMEYLANGVMQKPIGNRSRYFAPQGCYQCQGDDAWCVISIPDDEKWQRFCEAARHREWISDPRFADTLSRMKYADELDRVIESWTLAQTPSQVTAILQGAGVAAAIVQNPPDLLEDPHLKERGFIVTTNHPELEEVTHPGLPFKLSETPGGMIRHAPILGEHNAYVFGELLGMPREEIEKLKGEGVFI